MYWKKIKRKFKYNQKSRYLLFFIILLIGCIGLGYASIVTNLSITGTSNFSSASWNVHFANIQVKNGSVTPTIAPTISNGTTVSFSAQLEEPGDYYEFNIDVVNSGSLDAMIDSVRFLPVLTSEQQNYFDYIVTYSDGAELDEGHALNSGDTETLRIAFIYKTLQDTSLYPDEDQDFNVSVQINYIQTDGNEVERPLFYADWVLPAGRTVDNLVVGDEIVLSGVTDEHFNFIGYDGDDMLLLSKYNLKVGRSYYHSSYSYSIPYTSSDLGYGLQDSNMIGYSDQSLVGNGVVAFSYTNYWNNNGEINSKYLERTRAIVLSPNVFDTDYVTEPDFSTTCDNATNCFYTEGYSIAYYVNQYKNILTGSGYRVNIKNARLLTYDDARFGGIGCSNSSCPTNSFITNTSFWLGSVYGSESSLEGIWCVISDGNFTINQYSFDRELGVRPVLIVSKSSI